MKVNTKKDGSTEKVFVLSKLKGKFYYPNGVIYEGEFVKGQFHGEGDLICKPNK
jgi:hypothetical protein